MNKKLVYCVISILFVVLHTHSWQSPQTFYVCATPSRFYGINDSITHRNAWQVINHIIQENQRHSMADYGQQTFTKDRANSHKLAQTKASHLQTIQQQKILANKKVEQFERVQNYYNQLLHTTIFAQNASRYKRRLYALSCASNNQGAETKTFALTSSSTECLNRTHIAPAHFFHFCGNSAQLELHQECIDVIECAGARAQKLTPFPDLYALNNTVFSLADVARDFNVNGQLAKGYKVLDLCYAITDCGYAALQGVGDGVIDTAQALLHPVETVKSTALGLVHVGKQLAIVLRDVCDISVSLAYRPEYAQRKIDEHIAQIQALSQAVIHRLRTTPARQLIRGTTKFATEAYLQGKILTTAGPILSKGLEQATACAKRYTSAEEVVAQAGPYAQISSSVAKEFFYKTESVGQKTGIAQNATKFPSSISREIVLPKMASYEQARNKALEIIGKVDVSTSTPHWGKFGIFEGKKNGRKWLDGKVIMYLDYDPIKGPHVNVKDYRMGKGKYGKNIAIPFNGTEQTAELLLKHLQ